ncbi:MAG: ImmA/IrrE family metallo-endopeptidase [Anaerolineae bacterium]|nr:ImmA/IrrE family metallo-endopeptidase [Anaerolineae bacterium]
MRRGFKADAERQALDLRQSLSLSIAVPLIGTQLAKHLEVLVSSANRIPRIPNEIREQLWEADNMSWSAFTISHEHKGKRVFYNPTHPRGRHESNVMHEISHILCNHAPSKFVTFENCDFSLRTCDPEQEEEADWFSGCLKLPRESLIWAVRQKMENEEIASHFVTSLEMVKFRRNVTGVDRQIQQGRKRWQK